MIFGANRVFVLEVFSSTSLDIQQSMFKLVTKLNALNAKAKPIIMNPFTPF
jgi:hypothetical protein